MSDRVRRDGVHYQRRAVGLLIVPEATNGSHRGIGVRMSNSLEARMPFRVLPGGAGDLNYGLRQLAARHGHSQQRALSNRPRSSIRRVSKLVGIRDDYMAFGVLA